MLGCGLFSDDFSSPDYVGDSNVVSE